MRTHEEYQEALDREYLLRKIMVTFKGAFINYNNELILISKSNLYFRLEGVNTELDLKCKLLEWCSRDADKAMPYSQQWRNDKYNNEVLNNINIILDTSFTSDDIGLIYTRLGNCCNHSLTVAFVMSGYDLDVLRSDE